MKIRLSLMSFFILIVLIGCGEGSSSSDNSSNDVTKITKSNISDKTFNIKDFSNNRIYITTFNSDGTITGGGSKFSSDFEWKVSKTGELQTLYKLFDTTLTIITHKQTSYEDECYIVSSTETNSNWTGEYKICSSKSIDKPTLTSRPYTENEDSIEIEIEGEIGTKVFVNGIDSGDVIDSNGKTQIILDISGEGEKYFSISLKDDNGNESETLDLVWGKDDSHNPLAPQITIRGENPVIVAQGTTYVDAGATATDSTGATVSITSLGSTDSSTIGMDILILSSEGSVDTSTIGTYIITYNATNKRQNPNEQGQIYSATETREVRVVSASDIETTSIAHYKFDGNTKDSSENNTQMTISNAIYYTDGKFNKGIGSTDNSGGDQIKILNPFINEKFTISFWSNPLVKHNKMYGDSNIHVWSSNTIQRSFIFSMSSGNLDLYHKHEYPELSIREDNGNASNGDSFYYGQNQLKNQEWQHIVLSYDNGIINIYVDGRKIIQNKKTIISPIGRDLTISLRGEDKVDDLRIYNRILSEEEIQELYLRQ